MSLSRCTAAAVAAGIAALLVAPQVLPASAAPQAGVAVAPARAGQALIQGVVVDQFGTPVDGVEVQATKADGTPTASALTYASDREDGPQHGYFFLEVTRGTYTVTFTRSGYKTLVLDDLQVAKGRKLSLGETEIEKKLIESKTSAALAQKKITTKQNGVVTVTVSANGVKPTGDVEIREGREVVGTGRLKTGDKGVITIGLDRLPKGAHDLKAVYVGSRSVKASSSPTVTLTVTKARH
ncbi:MAG TPA: Ig-like domain repeat protein [Nocardioides sp.]|nr:Ig-like domain repeat protein [Nocardioides sp.]